MSEEPIKTPQGSKIYLYLGVFFLLLPTVLNLYKGETERLIVASGKITGPHFSESVVFMFRHRWDSAVGVIINKPLPEEEMKSIPSFLRDKNLPLYYGGPVKYPDYLTVVEQSETEDGRMQITARNYDEAVGEDPQYLSKIMASVAEGEDRYRIYIGYAGWGLFQLEREFGNGNWASTNLQSEWIFNRDMTSHDAWVKALEAATNKRKPRNPGMI